MAIPFFKIYYTAPGEAEIDISDSVMFNQKRGLEMKSGKLEFTVKNSPNRAKNDGETIFVEEGLVEVYVDYSPITRSSNQLLLSAQITKIEPSISEKESKMKLTCTDRTSLLLGGIWNKNYENESASSIIKNIVAQVSNGQVTTSNVATTKTGGGAFPVLDYYNNSFKPIYEWISELSEPGYTGEDRAYLFYVDSDNDLHWFYPSQTSSGSIVEGTDNIYDMQMSRNSESVINMVIFNAGQDLNGNGTLGYFFDATSKSNELKMKYFPMTDLSTGQFPNMFDLEIAAGNLTQSSTGEVPYQGKLYAAATSGTTNWGATFSTFNEYNEEVRDYLKEKGTERAKAIVARFGKLLWSGNVRLKGTNSFTAGDLITFTSKTFGIRNYLLRVHDVTHSVQKTGWTTTLQLKEDEEAIAASVPGE